MKNIFKKMDIRDFRGDPGGPEIRKNHDIQKKPDIRKIRDMQEHRDIRKFRGNRGGPAIQKTIMISGK